MNKFKDRYQDEIVGEPMFCIAVSQRTGEISIAGEMEPLCLVLRDKGLGKVKIKRLNDVVALGGINGKRRFVMNVDKKARKIVIKETDLEGGDIRWEVPLYCCAVEKLRSGFVTQHHEIRKRFAVSGCYPLRNRGNIQMAHNGEQKILDMNGIIPGARGILTLQKADDVSFRSDEENSVLEGHFAKAIVTGWGTLSAVFKILPYKELQTAQAQ